MVPNGIGRKANAVKPQMPKPRRMLSVPAKTRWRRPTTSSKAFALIPG